MGRKGQPGRVEGADGGGLGWKKVRGCRSHRSSVARRVCLDWLRSTGGSGRNTLHRNTKKNQLASPTCLQPAAVYLTGGGGINMVCCDPRSIEFSTVCVRASVSCTRVHPSQSMVSTRSGTAGSVRYQKNVCQRIVCVCSTPHDPIRNNGGVRVCVCVYARSKRKEGRKKNIPAALPLVLDSSHRVRPWNCLPPSAMGVRQEQEQSSDGGLRLARPRRRTWRPRPWAEIDGTVGHRISLLVKLTSNVGETDEDGVLCPESESSPLRSKSVVVIDQVRRCLASAELLDDELGIAVHVDPFRRDSRPLRRVQRHC